MQLSKMSFCCSADPLSDDWGTTLGSLPNFTTLIIGDLTIGGSPFPLGWSQSFRQLQTLSLRGARLGGTIPAGMDFAACYYRGTQTA